MSEPNELYKANLSVKNNVAGEEIERENELRVFCLFRNRKTGKWRLTRGDSVFVSSVLSDVNLSKIIKQITKEGKQHKEP